MCRHTYVTCVLKHDGIEFQPGRALQLSLDHKPSRADEAKRIEEAGLRFLTGKCRWEITINDDLRLVKLSTSIMSFVQTLFGPEFLRTQATPTVTCSK